MPLLPALSPDEASPSARATLEQLRAKLGQVPNMYRTFAHAPNVLNASVAMSLAIRADLDPKVRELAYLKVTQLTDCHVCRHYHERIARSVGVTEEQMRDLGPFETSPAFTEAERDVLRFTEQWSREGAVAADVLERLAQVLSARDLVILGATVAQANFTSRFNNVFGVELP